MRNIPPNHEEEAGGSAPGGRRRDRAQGFRRPTNQNVINEFEQVCQEKLKSQLFSEFDSLSTTAHVVLQPQSVRLSFTTRGIGLTLFETLNRIGLQMPQLNIPVMSFFRVSLLQLAAKHDQVLLTADVDFCDAMEGLT